MGDMIPPIYSKSVRSPHYDKTVVAKGTNMKAPTKSTAKSKQVSSASKKFLPPMKAGNHMVGKQTSKPAKKC